MEEFKVIVIYLAVVAALLIGAVFALWGIVTFPRVMCNETCSLVWLIGYIGYIAVTIVLYKKFLD
jgi:hypothetical protein